MDAATDMALLAQWRRWGEMAKAAMHMGDTALLRDFFEGDSDHSLTSHARAARALGPSDAMQRAVADALHRLEVSDGWAELRLLRLLGQEARRRVACYKLTAQHAERDGKLWAKPWIGANTE
jgi:hypothetical protein